MLNAARLLWIPWVMFLSTTVAVPAPADDVTGWWHIVDEVKSTNYEPFRGMRLEYRVLLRQEGAWLLGEGRKVREHGQPLPPSRQTEIAIAGTVDAGRVTATLIEKGGRRESRGRFAWTLTDDGRRLRGTFESDAAGSSGSSTARRESPL